MVPGAQRAAMRSAVQLVQATASTSGRPVPPPGPASGAARRPQRPAAAAAAAAAAAGAAWRRRRGAHVARVTNEGKEMIDPAVIAPDDDEYVLVDPQNPVPNPELGPLEHQVGLPYEEALFLDEPDPEAMAYWFTEPPGGWQTEPRRLRKLPVAPGGGTAMDSFAHEGPDAEGRIPLSEVREGQVYKGTVVAQLLYHGCQVDIGAQFDALLAIEDEQWLDSAEELAVLEPGAEVEVRVWRVRRHELYRFPIQVVAADADLQACCLPPEEHQAPMDLRVMRWSPQEIEALTNGERRWDVAEMTVPLESDLPENKYRLATEAPAPVVITAAHQAAIDDVADRIMQGW